MGTNNLIIFLLIGVVGLILLIGLLIDAFEPKKQGHDQKEKEVVENEQPTESTEFVPEPIKVSPDRKIYNAVKRQQEQVKKDREQLLHETRMNSLEAERNRADSAKIEVRGEVLNVKDNINDLNNRHIETLREALGVEQEKAKIELLKHILHFDGQKLEFEKTKAKEELARQLFETKMQMQMEKMALEAWKMNMTQYFHEQFNTLDTEKIKLLMEQQKSEHQKMVLDLKSIELDIASQRETLKYQFQKLDLETIKVDMQKDALKLKEWESDLHVSGNQQRIRQDQFEFWEDRVLKQYGFPDFQSYFNRWQSMNDLAKQYNYSSIDSFAYQMLSGGKYEQLVNSYQELQYRYQKLLGQISEN